MFSRARHWSLSCASRVQSCFLKSDVVAYSENVGDEKNLQMFLWEHVKRGGHLVESMAWDYVSELRPPTSLLLIPQIIYEYGQPRWNDIDRIKPKNSATLYTANPIWTDPGANPGLRGETTNHLSHGTAFV
jgi:hypothetical protein